MYSRNKTKTKSWCIYFIAWYMGQFPRKLPHGQNVIKMHPVADTGGGGGGGGGGVWGS